MVDVCRGVSAKDNLGRRSIEKVSQCLARGFDNRICFGAGGIGPVGVRVMVIEIFSHRIDHCARRLRASGTVKVGDWMPVVKALEGGKLGANLLGRQHQSTDYADLTEKTKPQKGTPKSTIKELTTRIAKI